MTTALRSPTANDQRRPNVAKKMTAEHKAALGEGRKHSRAVRSYLEALEANKPKRGRKRTPASIQARLDTIEETIEQASVLDRLLSPG